VVTEDGLEPLELWEPLVELWEPLDELWELPVVPRSPELAALPELVESSDPLEVEEVVVLLWVVATCLLDTDNAGSLPWTIWTKITSQAARNTPTDSATTRRLMLRAFSRRARSRAPASDLPDS
jgi:hypothetical protein